MLGFDKIKYLSKLRKYLQNTGKFKEIDLK